MAQDDMGGSEHGSAEEAAASATVIARTVVNEGVSAATASVSAASASVSTATASVSAATASAQREDGTVNPERRVKSSKLGSYLSKRPKRSAISVRSELDRVAQELRHK